uniref:Uncharacterized protein n=1 Tax=Arundo donax TaxID=35708 RepID=A0A0A9BBK6_ARUDO
MTSCQNLIFRVPTTSTLGYSAFHLDFLYSIELC